MDSVGLVVTGLAVDGGGVGFAVGLEEGIVVSLLDASCSMAT